MAIANAITGRDLAGLLAATLGLGSGPILGAILGGGTGTWLILGGRRRIAGLVGIVCGLGAAIALWNVARGEMWIADAVLEGAFGAGADEYSGLAVVLVLVVLGRLVADVVAAAVRKLLERAASRA
jgi:hypothetical protein